MYNGGLMVKGRLKFSHHLTIGQERRARMANEYHFQQPSLSNNSFPVTFAISFPVTKVVFISVRGRRGYGGSYEWTSGERGMNR